MSETRVGERFSIPLVPLISPDVPVAAECAVVVATPVALPAISERRGILRTIEKLGRGLAGVPAITVGKLTSWYGYLHGYPAAPQIVTGALACLGATMAGASLDTAGGIAAGALMADLLLHPIIGGAAIALGGGVQKLGYVALGEPSGVDLDADFRWFERQLDRLGP
jgi:hypothetical protein